MKTIVQLLILLSVLVVGGCATTGPGVVYMPQQPNDSMSSALKVMTAAGHSRGFVDVSAKLDPSVAAMDYSTPINDTLLAAGYFTDFYTARGGISNSTMGTIALVSALLPTMTEAERYSSRVFAWIPADQASSPEEAKEVFARGILSVLESKFGNEPGYRLTHVPERGWYAHTDAKVLDTSTGKLYQQNVGPRTLFPMRYLFSVLSADETEIHPFNNEGKYYLVIGRVQLNVVEGESLDVMLKLYSDVANSAPDWYYQFLYHDKKVPMVLHQDKIFLFVKPGKEPTHQASAPAVNS